MRHKKLMVAAAVCTALVVICVISVVVTRAGLTGTRELRLNRTPATTFEATPTSGAAPLAVQYTYTSKGSPRAWTWHFGDGTMSTDQHPSHTYQSAGKYTVTLQIATAGGMSTVTKSDYITVNTPPSQPGWTTIVDDQFNTPGVPSHWLLYSGSYAGDATTCTSPSQVQVPGDGYLHLKMQYLTTGICGRGWYTGGMQIAKAYGGIDQAITVRWRIVPSADPNIVHSTRIIPMSWVDDPNYAWYQGESDYCEGGQLDGCYLYLHYGPSDQILHGYSVDLTQWHTFRIEQRNHQVSLFIDNLTTPVWVYKGNATTVPDAFKRAVLQQSCPLFTGCPPASYAGDVEDIEIDWITIQNATTAVGGVQPGIASVVHDQKTADTGATTGHSTSATSFDGVGTGALMSVLPLDLCSTPATELRRRSSAEAI